jgi:hypothetical protein
MKRVTPVFCTGNSDNDCEPRESHDPPKKKQKAEITKVNRKAKIPPGLALMQGFSAKNVGNGRLTVRTMQISASLID